MSTNLTPLRLSSDTTAVVFKSARGSARQHHRGGVSVSPTKSRCAQVGSIFCRAARANKSLLEWRRRRRRPKQAGRGARSAIRNAAAAAAAAGPRRKERCATRSLPSVSGHSYATRCPVALSFPIVRIRGTAGSTSSLSLFRRRVAGAAGRAYNDDAGFGFQPSPSPQVR